MNSTELVAHISKLQRELAGMRDFQTDYLERRRTRGTRTATDAVMEGHISTIGETLDLLEAIKAIGAEIAEEETP